MRFAFDDEQKMLQDALRGVLNRSVPASRVRAWAEEDDLAAFDAFAAENGWQGLGTDEDDGGQGGGLVELAIFFEEIGRAVAPSDRLLTAIGLGLPLAKLLPGGIDALPDVADGSAGIAVVIPAGQPLDLGIGGIEVYDGRLSGHVPLVLGAQAAAHLLVPQSTERGLDVWLVSALDPGVVVTPRHLIDRTRRYGDVTFAGAPARLLGTVSHEAATVVTARAALLVAAESLGLARRMLEMTTEYVRERVQFGVPVGTFQAVKHSAAEALVDIEAAHSGIYYAAWALQNKTADGLIHAWIVKAFVSEIAAKTADRSLFLHGAIGYTWEYDLHYFYKRAKANLELLGSPRKYRERIADGINLVSP
jgi:alkylation response protein AidB-like acyl-CoA dehydrogenase